MALSRRFARPLFASIFIVGGVEAAMNPVSNVDKAGRNAEPLREHTGMAAFDRVTLVRINGAVQIVAGALLATGRVRRLACVALMGSLVPTTLAAHRFWDEPDRTRRSQQQMHLLKNVSLFGGLLLAAGDTEDRPSVGGKARHKRSGGGDTIHLGDTNTMVRDAKNRSTSLASGASAASRSTLREATAVRRRARRRAKNAGLDPAGVLASGRESVRHVQDVMADGVGYAGGTTAQALQQAAAMASGAARQLDPMREAVTQSTAGVAAGALSKLGVHLPSN